MTSWDIVSVDIKVRKRPALYRSPGWQEHTEAGDPLPATEIWRNKRITYEQYKLAVWTYDHNPYSKVIGLWLHGPTHFAFLIDDITDWHLNDGWYFDGGNSCPELFVEPEEWRRALNELDIPMWSSTFQPQMAEMRETDIKVPNEERVD